MIASDESHGSFGNRKSCGLAPMQEAMILHSLQWEGGGFEIEQLVGELDEELDQARFRDAWQQVAARHAVLRTRFRWAGQASNIQEVLESPPLDWIEKDWTKRELREQDRAFSAFLQADRTRGFPLDQAPPWRVTLFQLGAASFRFVWTFHHALLDGRSIPLVLREVFACLDAGRRGRSREKRPEHAYQNHIHWLARQDFAATESFWRARLRGLKRPTSLRFAVPRGNAGASRRGERDCRLSPATTAQLRALAGRHGFTLNTLVQGAWALLLSRATGDREVLFGATRAGRGSAEPGARDAVGLFINTLPLRVAVDPALPCLEWLAQLRAQWNELRPCEHTPLAKIRAWSELPPGGPFLESIVVFEHQPIAEQLRSQGGEWLRRQFRLIEQPAAPVVLNASGGKQLTLQLLFDREQFDEGIAQHFVGHLRNLLQALAADPHQRVGQLPLLTREQQRRMVASWNGPVVHFAPRACLHQLFEAQVRRTPDAVAVVGPHDRLTYAQINHRANRVAQALQQRGVGPETRVGLFLDRSAELIVGLLGVLKAGGAYLPIDETWPAEQVSVLLRDGKASLLLTRRELAGKVAGCDATVLCVDELSGPADDHGATDNPASGATPGHLAYVIYTSGSTGRPRGVPITHHNVVRLFQATRSWFHFGREDTWTLFHSPAFDFSTWEIWGALLHGGRLVLVPNSVKRSPADFGQLLLREKVTVLNQTPSAFCQLVQLWAGPESPPDESPMRLPCRWIILGGEALEVSALKPWFERFGDRHPRIINMYGLTESTVHTTYRPIRKTDLSGGSVVGVPLPDLQLYILDENGDALPLGMPGEICIGGDGLARGYLDRPQLTAERFISSPFSDDPNARLYRTGDRARLLPGRDVEYLGRLDDQIKVRGFRIEPAEIEAVLREHPDVRQAVVVACDFQPGDRRLVGYVVLGSAPLPLEDLRRRFKNRLPEHLWPATVVALEKMPLTTNGKIDRAALPPPGRQAVARTPIFAAPGSGLERTIAEIWQELLQVDRVGVDDHFFEMGGHSLLMVQLHARLQAALQRSVPITVLFQCPTISSLSRRLSAETAGPDRLERLRRTDEYHQRMK